MVLRFEKNIWKMYCESIVFCLGIIGFAKRAIIYSFEFRI